LHGDTKIEKSRRTLALPQNAVTALRSTASGKRTPIGRRTDDSCSIFKLLIWAVQGPFYD